MSQINQLVDWCPISSLLNKRCLKQAAAPMGAPSYPTLLLFKRLLQVNWYGLSDREVEERINDSISRNDFLELDLTNAPLDHSTICRFRLELVDKGLMERLFKLFDRQLQQHGIMAIKEGAIVGASIVDSPNKSTGSQHTRLSKQGYFPLHTDCRKGTLLHVRPTADFSGKLFQAKCSIACSTINFAAAS